MAQHGTNWYKMTHVSKQTIWPNTLGVTAAVERKNPGRVAGQPDPRELPREEAEDESEEASRPQGRWEKFSKERGWQFEGNPPDWELYFHEGLSVVADIFVALCWQDASVCVMSGAVSFG